jgi:short-chain fatty acids transporter
MTLVLRFLGLFFSKLMRKYLPDPLIFAILLTLLTFGLGVFVQKQSAIAMITYMGDGFWNLLSFAMQMSLILVTGHILASTKLMGWVLRTIAKQVKSRFSAIVLVCMTMILTSYLNWGFGLVFTSLLTVETASNMKGKALHYPLLVASAYSGFLVWHVGLSGSAPLLVNTKGHFLEMAIGLIPVSETIFSPIAYIPTVVLFFTLPFIMASMHPKKADEIVEFVQQKDVNEKESHKDLKSVTPADKIENSKLLPFVFATIGTFYILHYFLSLRGSLDLNILNFIFLMLGLFLHGTPKAFVHAAADAGKNLWSIVIQFPLYAGIMGMMINSGLAASIANWFASISTAKTLPLLTYYSAGLINLFIPSGGGQWSIQGPIMVQAAQQIGAPISKVVMGFSWGDAWTNMVQPFWALPLIAIAKVNLREIMGYCVIALIWAGFITSFSLLCF